MRFHTVRALNWPFGKQRKLFWNWKRLFVDSEGFSKCNRGLSGTKTLTL